jgi:hypothetical protein
MHMNNANYTTAQPETKQFGQMDYYYASVAFNIEGRRWSEHDPEYATVPISGKIVVTREADGEEVQVGTISAYLLRFWEYADPVVLFDAPSGSTCECLQLFDLNNNCELKPKIENLVRADIISKLLLIDRVEVNEAHRGHGLGHTAAQITMTTFR